MHKLCCEGQLHLPMLWQGLVATHIVVGAKAGGQSQYSHSSKAKTSPSSTPLEKPEHWAYFLPMGEAAGWPFSPDGFVVCP